MSDSATPRLCCTCAYCTETYWCSRKRKDKVDLVTGEVSTTHLVHCDDERQQSNNSNWYAVISLVTCVCVWILLSMKLVNWLCGHVDAASALNAPVLVFASIFIFTGWLCHRNRCGKKGRFWRPKGVRQEQREA